MLLVFFCSFRSLLYGSQSIHGNSFCHPPPPPPHPQAYDEFMPIGFDGNEKKIFFFHQN